MYSKYAGGLIKNSVILNDILQQKEYVIYKSAMSYNPDKGSKFSTWLANQMRYFCLNSMNKNRLVATEDESKNNRHSNVVYPNQDTLNEEKVDFVKNIIAQVKDKGN